MRKFKAVANETMPDEDDILSSEPQRSVSAIVFFVISDIKKDMGMV